MDLDSATTRRGDETQSGIGGSDTVSLGSQKRVYDVRNLMPDLNIEFTAGESSEAGRWASERRGG